MLMILPLYSKCDRASDLWQQIGHPSPRDFEILVWYPAGPVLPYGEKVPL